MRSNKEMLQDGAILEAYTQKNFCKFYLIPTIEKVKVEIIEQNTSGKDFLSYYMNMEEFRELSEEIMSGACATKLNADMESQYPSAYKYTTGKDGCKHLAIGGGKKGVRVQISVTDENKKTSYKMSIIPWVDLKRAAFWFRLIAGLQVVQGGSYYHTLEKCFWQGEAKRSEYFKNSFNAREDEAESPEEQARNAAQPEVKQQEVVKEAAPVVQQPSTPTPDYGVGGDTNVPNDEKVTMRLKVVQRLTDMSNGTKKAFQGNDVSGATINVILTETALAAQDAMVENILRKASVVGEKVEVTGRIKGDRLYVTA